MLRNKFVGVGLTGQLLRVKVPAGPVPFVSICVRILALFATLLDPEAFFQEAAERFGLGGHLAGLAALGWRSIASLRDARVG